MNDDARFWLELAALQLAALVVAVHLYWGLDRLAGQLRHGVFYDPRPAAFVLSSALIVAGVAYYAVGGRRAPVYALGIALMATYLLGYWAWHLVGHVPAMPWVEDQPHPHPEWGPVETLSRHLAADGLALFSKLVELALAALLAVLWYDDRRGLGRTTAASTETLRPADPAGDPSAEPENGEEGP